MKQIFTVKSSLILLFLMTCTGFARAQCLCLYFTSFNAQKIQNTCNTKLTWLVADQPPGSSSFAIDRSANGAVFVQVATVPGNPGSTSELGYSYTDSNPYHTSGIVYYRVRFVSNETTIDNTPISSVNMGSCISPAKPLQYCSNVPTLSGPSNVTFGTSPSYGLTGGTPQTVYWSSSNTAIATISNTGTLTTVSAGSVVITAKRPYCNDSFSKTVYVCPDLTKLVATNLTGTLTWLSGGSYGYQLYFNPPSPAPSYYQMQWSDVTSNAITGGITITAPGALYSNFTAGHTYKYRLAAYYPSCGAGPYSAWSALLLPPPCRPDASAMTVAQNCGSGCATLSWPPVPDAVSYQIQYTIYDPAQASSLPPGNATFSSSSGTISYSLPSSPSTSGWVIRYRVATDCGTHFINYCDWSEPFALY